MAVLRSNRLVTLNCSGEVISVEWHDHSAEELARQNADECYAMLDKWRGKSSYHVSIGATQLEPVPITIEEKPFGYNHALRPTPARRQKRFSTI